MTRFQSSVTAHKPRGRMTEKEFLEYAVGRENARLEWVDGEVVEMSPVTLDHDDLVRFLDRLIGGFVVTLGLGKVQGEQYQIRLPRQRRRRMADVFFVAESRSELLRRMECNGPPDLVVEVISPDSIRRDRQDKFAEYQAAGVAEYWIVDPLSRRFDAYSRNARGKLVPIPADGPVVRSIVLPGLYFRVEWVWQIRLPDHIPLILRMVKQHRKLISESRE